MEGPQPFLVGFQDASTPLIQSANEGAIEGIVKISHENQLMSYNRGDNSFKYVILIIPIKVTIRHITSCILVHI